MFFIGIILLMIQKGQKTKWTVAISNFLLILLNESENEMTSRSAMFCLLLSYCGYYFSIRCFYR